MNINRQALDLSHYETVDDYQKVKADGIVGIIWKATQGATYTDPTYSTEKKRALQAGLLWGSYHFADNSNLEAQINNYLNYAKPEKDEIFCLDYEPNGNNTMDLNKAIGWIQGVENALERPTQCLFYSGNLVKEKLGDKVDPFLGQRRLWLAQYGSNPVVQPSWKTFWLWQYTDGEVGPGPHTVNGIKGGIDCNSFNGTPEQLKAEWSGGEPTPIPVVPEIVILAPAGVKITVKQQT